MSILSKLESIRVAETGGSLRNVEYSHPSAIGTIKIYPSTDISVIATRVSEYETLILIEQGNE